MPQNLSAAGRAVASQNSPATSEAKNVGQLIISPLSFSMVTPIGVSPTLAGHRAGHGVGWRRIAIASMLLTRCDAFYWASRAFRWCYYGRILPGGGSHNMRRGIESADVIIK